MRYSMLGRVGRAGIGTSALLALVVGLTGGATTAATAAGPAPTAAVRADLTRYLDARRVPDHISALSLRVTYPGARPGLAVSVGTTSYGGHAPVSDDALWQIGSNTKAFTSVVLLQLEAERKLSIHDRLGKWLPQYPAWRDVTIRQLLSMTSGIPNYSEQPAWLAAIQANPSANFTAASLIGYVKNLPLGPPTWAYSNTNYLLALLIIERAAHDSYFRQVATRILGPLGMRNTCFAPETCSPRIAPRVPASYSMQADMPALVGKRVPPLAMSWGQAAGGLIASLEDMMVWDRALYGGRELPAAQQRELESLISVTTSRPINTVTAGDPHGFGLGVGQVADPAAGVTWTYQGGTLGFRVLHFYVPRTGLLMAVAVNSDIDASTLPALADTLYQTLAASR